MNGLEIKELEDHPASATIVADWVRQEWRTLPIHDYYRDVAWGNPTDRACLPRTLVALRADETVGTVSLLMSDMETRPDLNPWLGCLVVRPLDRGRGLGTRLVCEGMALARKMAIDRLYLFTEKDEALYHRIGWTRLETEQYEGKLVTLMAIDLPA